MNSRETERIEVITLLLDSFTRLLNVDKLSQHLREETEAKVLHYLSEL